jgi:hypothetical protein
MASSKLLEAVAVTAELCGRVFSEPAARVFVSDLSCYEEAAVLKALTRCRKEVRGVLTVADVISRIDDGRPGPDEAWAMVPLSESESVVWTEEMAKAFSLCNFDGGLNAARLAFREAYKSLVDEARSNGVPAKWAHSLGWNPRGREQVLTRAVQLGRLKQADVVGLIPDMRTSREVVALLPAMKVSS